VAAVASSSYFAYEAVAMDGRLWTDGGSCRMSRSCRSAPGGRRAVPGPDDSAGSGDDAWNDQTFLALACTRWNPLSKTLSGYCLLSNITGSAPLCRRMGVKPEQLELE